MFCESIYFDKPNNCVSVYLFYFRVMLNKLEVIVFKKIFETNNYELLRLDCLVEYIG